MVVTLSSTLNTATLNSKLLIAGIEQQTKTKILLATSGYTPRVGDVLVKNLADSGSDNIFDYDDIATKTYGTANTVSAFTFANTSPIIWDTLKIYSDTAYATKISNSTIGYTDGVPAKINALATGTATLTATNVFTYEFCEQSDQVILGVIIEIDQTDTTDIVLTYMHRGGVHFSALGTDGTASTTSKGVLVEKLEDLGVTVVGN